MPYYLIAAGLIAHTFFWGTGLAKLILPWRWQPWWWAVAPGCGLALQSAVVWAGAHTSLPGTNSYAWWSELLPLALLAAAFGRRKVRWNGRTWKRLIRSAAVPLLCIALIGAWFLLSPMAAAGQGVTSSSLGSCDHADYAAGARVLAEFSRDDRTGLLGLSEVTRIGSAEYFFDFWLRLNHFTPSALIAHNSTIFGIEIHRLISVSAAVLLLLNLPAVYLLSRIVAGLKPAISFFVAALYVLSPLSAYAVHQGALGQLLGAQGIALLIVALAILLRETAPIRRLWPMGGLLLAILWLLAGSYNFILVICLAQAGPWLLGRAWINAKLRRAFEVALLTTVALAVCMMFFWPRFSGIVERFQLFADHDYGWSVPTLTWEGWIGLVDNVALDGLPAGWRGTVMAVLAAGWIGGLLWAWRRNRTKALSSAALLLPVAVGWTILTWESLSRANASYDAFKILSVFYPGLLAGMCGWLMLRRPFMHYSGTVIFMGLILTFNLVRADEFRRKMASPPLRVDKHLAGLRKIETMDDVESINLPIKLYWARLWADAFLLRKPHYFSQPTYEGRNVTPLRGQWDLLHTMLHVIPQAETDRHDLGKNFQLVRVETAAMIQLKFGLGWHTPELSGSSQWCWSHEAGQIEVNNTAARPIRASLRLLTEGLRRGDSVSVELNGQHIMSAELSREPGWSGTTEISLPPGSSILTLRPGPQNLRQFANDERKLGVALHLLELRLLPEP